MPPFLGATFDDRTLFNGADIEKAKFWETGGVGEEERGLAAIEVVKAKNWKTAIFSEGFLLKLEALSPPGTE